MVSGIMELKSKSVLKHTLNNIFKRDSPAPVGAARNNPATEETAPTCPGDVTGNRGLVHAEAVSQSLLFAMRQFTDHRAYP